MGCTEFINNTEKIIGPQLGNRLVATLPLFIIPMMRSGCEWSGMQWMG